MDELVANLKDFLSTVSLRIVEVFSHLGVIKDLHDSFLIGFLFVHKTLRIM